MDKNAKMVIIGLIICILGLCLAMCSDEISSSIATIITGEDGKCDYCGAKASVEEGTKEYCSPCFHKYDGNIWD